MKTIRTKYDVKHYFEKNVETLGIPKEKLPALRTQFEHLIKPGECDVSECLVEKLIELGGSAEKLGIRLRAIVGDKKEDAESAVDNAEEQYVEEVVKQDNGISDAQSQDADNVSDDAVEDKGSCDGEDDRVIDVPLADVIAYDVIQVRSKINDQAISDYAESYGDKAHMPPVVVFQTPQGRFLVDGGHRLAAMKAVEVEQCRVELRSGTRSDAVKYALTANAAHGVQRSNADKRLCVRLAMKEFPDASAREIARICGVAHSFASRIKKESMVKSKRLQDGDSNDVLHEEAIGKRECNKPVEESATADADADVVEVTEKQVHDNVPLEYPVAEKDLAPLTAPAAMQALERLVTRAVGNESLHAIICEACEKLKTLMGSISTKRGCGSVIMHRDNGASDEFLF